MAEFPNLIILWRDILYALGGKAHDLVRALERRVRDEYRRPGPRDN